MKCWTAVFTNTGNVLAVSTVAELSDGRLNVSVASRNGQKWQPGPWTPAQAQKEAERFAEELLGKEAAVVSRWTEYSITP